ncbi:3'-5' exonuclease [Flavisericum labens]|uniref:3'-5' exonuclease n=1 Tax=Flavisericum labens TaxID=3377112 RepID=UPI00387B6CE0
MKLKWPFVKRRKDLPDFWLDYLSLFKKKKKSEIRNTRFVAFDTETTGFDKKEDRILSIGAVALTGKTISVNDTLEVYLKQEVFKPETVKIHGIIRSGSEEKISEQEAIKVFLDYIKDAVLIAHHASFDKGMINNMLARHGFGKLKNRFIDTGVLYKKSLHIIYKDNTRPYTLDYLCKELNVQPIDRHTATGDALITALVFLKILSRLDKRKHLNWGYLLNR